MRKELSIENGKRKKFSALFSRIGKKVNFKGYSEETILLTNIIDLETNKTVADHLWFSYTQGFIKAKLDVGNRLEFEARVKEYRKGYVNKTIGINNQRADFKLSNPARIKKVTL